MVQDLQFLYVALVLPTLFGLTLVAEGLNKLLKNQIHGWITLIFGLLFIIAITLAYLFFL